ncbi:MAG: hypothetical protein ACLP8A_13920 [Methylovirgula sp.]
MIQVLNCGSGSVAFGDEKLVFSNSSGVKLGCRKELKSQAIIGINCAASSAARLHALAQH